MDILTKIDNYKKEKIKEINKYLDFNNNYNITFDANKNNIINITNVKTKNLVITGEINFYGVYNSDNKLWIWASSIPGINSKQFKKIMKIRSFDHLFEYSDDIKNMFYYQLLTQDTILIDDIKYLEWINNLLIYLSNDLYYFNPNTNLNNIQFITLKNIIEKYV